MGTIAYVESSAIGPYWTGSCVDRQDHINIGTPLFHKLVRPGFTVGGKLYCDLANEVNMHYLKLATGE